MSQTPPLEPLARHFPVGYDSGSGCNHENPALAVVRSSLADVNVSHVCSALLPVIMMDLGAVNGMAQSVNRRRMIMRVEVLMGKIMYVRSTCLGMVRAGSN